MIANTPTMLRRELAHNQLLRHELIYDLSFIIHHTRSKTNGVLDKGKPDTDH
jgi:hypothetical protein